MGLGPGEIALLVLGGLLLFGAKKLPELGRSAGGMLREFKGATKGLMDEEKPVEKVVEVKEEVK